MTTSLVRLGIAHFYNLYPYVRKWREFGRGGIKGSLIREMSLSF
jgi:hypothetical protein